ncbi:MAG TPA: serine/threonine-protein kinase [Polyangiales bacterium]|nr:serine/threonine-protein kinase [Polyangiales bacterium]
MDSKLPVQPEDVIADKYVVERVIGQGAVGVVVAARHRQLGRSVAIKFLRPELAQRLEVSGRFRSQARAAAAATGEHVCRVLDVCTDDCGVPYVVMEYAEGRDLARELEDRGALPYSEAVDYVLQACEGLAEGWVAGVVHGDLKPSKLYLTTRQDGSRCLKLLDLATSELSREPPASEYLAPEQLAQPERVTAATHVWALGMLLYRALTGRMPVSAEEIASALGEVRLPDGLAAVVERSVAMRTEERFGALAEFAQALAPFAPPRARISAERVSRLLPEAAPAERPVTPAPRRGRRWKLVLAACVPPLVGLFWMAGAGRHEASKRAIVHTPVHVQEHEHVNVREDVDLAGDEDAHADASEEEKVVVEREVPRVPVRRRVVVPPPAAASIRVSDFGGRR